jgi:serine/threonine protein kinase/WD40 repeat protein
MAESMSGSDLFDELAYEFAERYRRGERPSVEEYAERYPHLAGEIRELFPALVMMERVESEADRPRGPADPRLRRDGPLPERLGDYRILREVGRGGMGVVYEAVQESLGRHVALKVLSCERESGPVALVRFRREARTAALLHHSNIVPVFGVGEHDGLPYYAMQYIQGRGLDSVLREVAALRRRDGGAGADPLPAGLATGLITGRYPDRSIAAGAPEGLPPSTSVPDRPREGRAAAPAAAGRPSSDSALFCRAVSRYYREAARMARQAAEALAYAHAHGVVHRDIKPANLLLDDQGTIWVTDFGLAKAEDSDELTRPGDVVGTLRYLAPERFRGQADARSDLYSLGMTLYELLALEPAFRASHRVQLMHAILHEEPRHPRELDPTIPRDLETIVLKAIAKNPADRFADAGAMAAELGRFVEGRPIRSRRLSVGERVWRWSRRNPGLAGLSLVASILATILVVGSVAAAWIYREQRDAVTWAKRDTEASRDRALGARRESRAELGRSLLQQARAERISGRPGRRAAALEVLTRAAGIAREVGAPPEDLARLRDEAIAALALDDLRPVRTWSGLEWDGRITAFAPEADRYVMVGEGGTIHVHRLTDRSEIKVVGAERPRAREWPAFSPDGRFLSVWAPPSFIELWDLERGEVPASWPADVRGVAFRSDGRQVAALRADGELRLYDLPAMGETARHRLGFVVPMPMNYAWIALSGDGRRLAITRDGFVAVDVFDTGSGRLVRALPTPTPRDFGAVALDHAGAILAFAHDQAITIYDLADGAVLARFQGHQGAGIVPHFQPGGGLLATAAWDGMTRLWDPIRGRLLATLPGGLVGWHTDRSHLSVFRNPDIVTFQLGGAVGRRTIDGRALGDPPGRTIFGPARVSYSPDGRLIALPFRLDGVRIVRASDGKSLARLPVGLCDEARFLPDGGVLTYNAKGLCRWPIRHAVGGTWRLGPPEPLLLNEHWVFPSGLDAAASGHVVGVSDPVRRGAVLLDPDRPSRRTWLVEHRRVFAVAISPDGRWAATGSQAAGPDGREVVVWDAADGEPAARLEAGNARVAFSPDGRWLGVGGAGRYRFYRTGSWAPGAAVEHGTEGGIAPVAFHPGGRVAAVVDTSGTAVRLIEVETGRVIAVLEPPDPSAVALMSFSPDGRYLAVPQTDQRVHIWDLAAIRRALDDLGLAAGIPDVFGGGAAAGDRPAVDRIEVEGTDPARLFLLLIRQVLHEVGVGLRALGDPRLDDAMELVERGDRWYRMGQWRRASVDYRAALARRPEAVIANHALARLLAEAPGRGDPEEAVRRAQLAVRRWPTRLDYRLTLALALYRAGRFAEAAAELELDIPRDPDEPGLGGVVLAMCRQRLGQAAAAKAALAEAMRWRAAQPAFRPDRAAAFDRLLREAESVLAEVLPDLPADVFARE